MSLNLTPSLVQAVEAQYEKAMAAYPQKKTEVEAWLADKSSDEAVCLKFMYGYMPLNDIISYDVEVIASYAKVTLEMYEEIPYAKNVPEELFLTYVLSYRVNNENLDQSRSWLFSEIGPRVKDKKTMVEAALEVNYWCYEKATYIPTDGRTIAPFGMCKRAKGRCGEESTLAVSAMRSVGIPARQCYVPRWAHCDDNHAWVEIWADGKWHYLGACEPEPVLNKGWFTAAASKAMLVHAKAYSHFLNGENCALETPLYSLINSTETYGSCHTVSVTVTRDGQPLANVPVSFQLINYSELFEMYTENTDENGRASFLTGKGDLYICAEVDGVYHGINVDTRLQTEFVLEMEKGIRPEALEGTFTESFDLNPPKEIIPPAPSSDSKKEHEARLKHCEAVRAAYEDTFVVKSGISEKWDTYFDNSRGNHEEIQKFYDDPAYSIEEKELLLDTLNEKDFVDCTAEILASYLKAAMPYKAEWPVEVYQKYILAPRASHEMIIDYRQKSAELLASKGTELKTPAEVWAYLQSSMTFMPDYGVGNWIANPYGCLRYGMCAERALPIIFVQVCRALGIPARLNPVTMEPEGVSVADGQPVFEMVRRKKEEPVLPTVKLKLFTKYGKPIHYMNHFTLGRYVDGKYRSLHYWDLTLDGETTLEVLPGSYRIVTCMRQIDGAVSARLDYFEVKEDCSVEVIMREDRTAEKLKYVELPKGECRLLDKDGTAAEEMVAVDSLYQGKETILIFAEPGKEPTEHLFQEILECQDEYVKEGYRLVISLADPEGLKNETLKRVLNTKIDTISVLCTDDEYIYALHETFHVGDERLPFAAAVSPSGKGLFAFANYNIRTAWTLMNIFHNAEK